jgi:hypothetical protein
MKKLLTILFFLCITQLSYSQTFTQTFVDRCTGEVQVVTADFTTGSAVVSFYNKVRLFTYQQFVNGELQQWLVQQYAWWQALSPCSSSATQTQNAQNAANNATNSTTTTNNNSSGSVGGSSGSSSGGDKWFMVVLMVVETEVVHREEKVAVKEVEKVVVKEVVKEVVKGRLW